jgi:hypothetical protein
MAISLQRTADLRSFIEAVRPWLLRNEVEHNLFLSIVRGIIDAGIVLADPYCAVVRRGDEIVGCALRTPPHKLLLTQLSAEAVTFLVYDVGTVYDALPAVMGPAETARAFAIEWASLRAVSYTPGMLQRLYALEEVTLPNVTPPGRFRLAALQDSALAQGWLQAFVEEAGAFSIQPDLEARRLIDGNRLAFWDHGGPVSMAAVSGRTDHGARIGWVYTPPDHRRQGYAATLVARLTQRELDAGTRFCMLYTDLVNPTSNRLYQRLGYRPVADIRDYDFADARGSVE